MSYKEFLRQREEEYWDYMTNKDDGIENLDFSFWEFVDLWIKWSK